MIRSDQAVWATKHVKTFSQICKTNIKTEDKYKWKDKMKARKNVWNEHILYNTILTSFNECENDFILFSLCYGHEG